MQMKFLIKKLSGAVLLTGILLPAAAQIKPAYEMTVNGVKVIVQPSGNEIVEILTVFKGGVQNYPANKAGIESLAITALTECGTKKDSKNSFKDKLDKVSAEVNGSAGMDFSTITLNCINSDLDQVWPLYVDALTIPAFDTGEFKRIKQDAISRLKSQASQPDFAISKLAKETAFKGKDYAKSPTGEESTVDPLTAAETHDYYKSILTRKRMLIVVVAELDRATIEQKIKELISMIPDGSELKLSRYNYAPAKNTFTDQKKDLATNYIQGVTGGPQPGSSDFNAFSIAMRIFYDRQFLEVRTNNGLSYAPQTRFNGGLTPYTTIQVTTTNPDKYIGVMDNLIAKTHGEGFSSDEVKNTKTGYATSFYYRMETNSAQATSLATNEVLFNDWRRSLRINEDLKKVSVEDVNKAFNKYVKDITWVYQGDTSKVNAALYLASPSAESKLPDSKISNGNKN
jgi:predicted Zn-dependent peptidase